MPPFPVEAEVTESWVYRAPECPAAFISQAVIHSLRKQTKPIRLSQPQNQPDAFNTPTPGTEKSVNPK